MFCILSRNVAGSLIFFGIYNCKKSFFTTEICRFGHVSCLLTLVNDTYQFEIMRQTYMDTLIINKNLQ